MNFCLKCFLIIKDELKKLKSNHHCISEWEDKCKSFSELAHNFYHWKASLSTMLLPLVFCLTFIFNEIFRWFQPNIPITKSKTRFSVYSFLTLNVEVENLCKFQGEIHRKKILNMRHIFFSGKSQYLQAAIVFYSSFYHLCDFLRFHSLICHIFF